MSGINLPAGILESVKRCSTTLLALAIYAQLSPASPSEKYVCASFGLWGEIRECQNQQPKLLERLD